MKTLVNAISLLFALLLLLVSCAQGGVITQTTVPADQVTGGHPMTATPVEPSTFTPASLATDTPAADGEIVDLMKNIVAKKRQGSAADSAFISAQAAFDAALFARAVAADKGKNVVMSPLSVMLALAMTANGSDGQTLAEFEQLLGGGMSLDRLNEYLCHYMNALPTSGECKFSYADAIFVNAIGEFEANPVFLQTNADCYSASAYRLPFNNVALDAINNFVKEHTDGMIEEILDRLHPTARMVLVNALCFDAKWQVPYTEQSVFDGVFHARDGKDEAVKMMLSEESLYIRDKEAVGFVKSYADTRYAFAALLPNENVDLYDFVASLDGARLTSLLASRNTAQVAATIPKFSSDFAVELENILPEMGIPSAFTSAADFSRMANEDGLYIGRVVHKGYIEVTESGTRAAAATAVEIRKNGISFDAINVTLDRPFVYVIFDTETDLPLFMGVLCSTSAQ